MYGICNLSIVPLRAEPKDQSEMISQVLFGEYFEIIEKDKNWSKIKLAFDNCEGFIDNKQFKEIEYSEFQKLKESKEVYSGEVIDFISNVTKEFFTIPLGANLPNYNQQKFTLGNENYQFEGSILNKTLPKEEILQKAYVYLNTPYLWGGKTPFGIDCSGFTQMVYKLCGYKLLRNANEQATQGEVLSFIEESEPGDLAFFDNEEGEIIHVGIILNNYNIIHAHGKVRIDTLDHSGIFNADLQKHTHKLRVIKKII
ncbi:C40 family peptidase [Polaribacter dokdonensis]|uniref:NlpC/P60 family protein n=1 Tax=Polaribacter dokdonensis DSW-5 TaxID=1300348 RepID=A0A0M9CEV1_9FLAO|nr:C40 family peptidase [Polaribacter dokdonensis]KOY50485.1 NlpC/P60 family protein [Polaribacter dokdonensis DSW-5]SEE59474.1 SH3 domain-containing protein [Polaribacter dokdonensis DSW-5]